MTRTVLLRAPAKVNLFLGVGECLPDGYHAVRTVLHTLELADEVVVREAERLEVTCDPGLGIAEKDNLAYRAAAAMGTRFEREPAVSISVVKHIPHGAGLAGGSTDAAAVIVGVARLWDIDPLGEPCLSVARDLGADVPFFLRGGAALMEGRGDLFVSSLPPAEGVPVALVRPASPVPTAEAYRAFDEHTVPAGDSHLVTAALETADYAALGPALSNNMETAACSIVPEVCDALAWLRTQGDVLGAAVAGSGSAVFALVGGEQAARDISEAAGERGWWGAFTRLSAHGASVIDERVAE